MPVASHQRHRQGVTLIELMIVVGVIAIMLGVTFPSITAGLDSIRLVSSANSLASFLTSALTLADRRQIMVEVTIAPRENRVLLRSPHPDTARVLDIGADVAIAGIFPEAPAAEPGAPRSFYFVPGGTAPRFAVMLATAKGARRLVELDPIMGLPRVTRPAEGAAQ